MEFGVVVVWWLTLVGLGAVGLPLAAFVLRALPDRGASLALPTALAALFVPVYWLGHLRFGPLVVGLGAVLLAGVSVLAARRGPSADLRRFGEWVVVFTLAFLLVVLIRALDPSILPAGGEKFLDYGLFRAVLRASRLPPEDMWFAGRPVAYYYGGHLLAATLATLTATSAKYAYNLALAGFYAALVGAAYGVSGSIAAARGRSYRIAGVLGALLVGIASNAVSLLQAVLWLLPDETASGIADAVAERTALPTDALVSPTDFSYWHASRVIPHTINEFPLFAFLNGDLHAHMSSTPFLLLVAGIALAYCCTPPSAVRHRRLLVYGAIPPVAGLLAVVNTWSLPTAAGLTGLAVLFADAPARDLLPGRIARRLPDAAGTGAAGDRDGPAGIEPDRGGAGSIGGEAARMGAALFAAAGVVALAVLWALPFVLGPATGAEGRSLGVLPDRSGLLAFVLVHGWFLLVYWAYLLSRARPLTGGWRPAVAGGALLVVAGFAADAAAVALVVPPLALAWYLLRRSDDVGFETVLFVAGAGLVLVVEFLFVEEQAGPGRFNTVFKTYMQVWVLWATGAAAAVAVLLPRPGAIETTPTGRDWRAILSVAFAALLVLSTSIYGVAALENHVRDAPEPTLDATTWARTYHAQEWEAIQFLDAQPGRPVIVSAPGCWCNTVDDTRPYRWVNAPSSFTGLPTVAGWSHEVGYRGQAPYDRRVEDVRTIYTGTREKRAALLRRYDVRYVYVGPNERALYDGIDFDDSETLSVAFRNDAVTIYEVADSGA